MSRSPLAPAARWQLRRRLGETLGLEPLSGLQAAAAASLIEPLEDAAEQGASERLQALFAAFFAASSALRSLAQMPERQASQLEIAKSYAASGDLRCAVADALALRFQRDGEVALPDGEVLGALSILLAGLRRIGLDLPIDRRLRARLLMQQFRRRIADAGIALLAPALAWLSLLMLCLRREAHTLPVDTRGIVYGVHAEWSTRTRHVWDLIHREAQPATVLLLGRPLGRERALPALRQRLADAGIDSAAITLLWPLDGPALWRTALTGRRLSAKHLRCLREFARLSGWRPAFGERLAQCYRLQLGLAQADWLRRQPQVPAQLLLGHTGVADVSLLEAAAQSRGVRSIHWLHGVSGGGNFAAYSDFALCQSGYDARLMAALGGYAATGIVEPASVADTDAADDAGTASGVKPDATPSGRLLVLSNLLHPANRHYQRHGSAPERRFLGDVAAAAARLNLAPSEITWKPHPVFAQAPQAVRSEVTACVEKLGWRQWPPSWSLSAARGFEQVICSASTTLVDMLRLGLLPVLYARQPFDRRLLPGLWPEQLRAVDAAGIEQALRYSSDADTRSHCHAALLTRLEPGKTAPTLAEILAAASSASSTVAARA